MTLTRDAHAGLTEHWMTTAQRDDQALPVTVLARWRWFKAAARRDRWRYGVVEFLTICASAAVPVAAAAHLDTVIIAGLGGVVLIATGLRTTFGWHENWIEHSQIGYAIEREASLFLVASPPYEGADAVRQLVSRVELLADEGGQRWADRRVRLDHPATPTGKGGE